LWGPLAILLPLVLLRSFKGVLIALQFRHKAEEGKLVSK
jgi:cytochrome c oxidase subunit 3